MGGKQVAIYSMHHKILKIGCEEHELSHWAEHYKDIADRDNWVESDVETYGAFISMLNTLGGN